VQYDKKDRLVYIPIERRIQYLIREAKNVKAAKDVKLYGISEWFYKTFQQQLEARILLYKKEDIYPWRCKL